MIPTLIPRIPTLIPHIPIIPTLILANFRHSPHSLSQLPFFGLSFPVTFPKLKLTADLNLT